LALIFLIWQHTGVVAISLAHRCVLTSVVNKRTRYTHNTDTNQPTLTWSLLSEWTLCSTACKWFSIQWCYWRTLTASLY